MTKLVNRAKMTTATTGTGTITLGSAADGYQTFSDAGVVNSDVVRYTIEDGDAWEIGTGTYTASGTTLTRTVSESSSAGSAITLSGEAVVFVTAAVGDIQQPPSEGAFVDGDKTKLDGIETNATADQTAGEIKTAYESNANTNAFTDAEQSKLSGIEAGADVTDTANVTAAGALMDSEVANLAAVKSFDPADYATSAQGDLADTSVQPGDNVSTLTNDAGYTTNVGDITGVTAGNALTGGGTSGTVTINHADTSSQGSVNNSGTTVIQDVTLDTYGHVTALGSTTLSIPSAANNATITLSAGSQLTGGGNFTTDQSFNETITFNHGDTSALSGTYGSTANGTKIDTITVDSNGHVTAVATGATGDIDAVNAGSGLTGGGSSGSVTLNHADTSTQASVNNSGTTVIQDVTLDTYGHVTSLGSTTLPAAGGLFKGENGEVGGSAGDIFRVNEQTLNTDVTIDTDENANATGPLTVASGVTLTVTSGGNLSIV